jgi:methionine-rich copper-binding protein CopC
VSLTPYDANTTSVPSPVQLADGETYSARVVAVDNTDKPFTSESDPMMFRVDSHPEITGSNPANGTVVSGNGKDANLSLTLDRPADPATVSSSTVALSRNSESGGTPSYNVTCGSPCSTINIDPSGTLGEGRYTLSLNSVKSEEGVVIPGSIKFSVAFREDPSGGNANNGALCTEGKTDDLSPAPVSINATADEPATVRFDYSVTGNSNGSGLRIFRDGAATSEEVVLTGSGTGARLAFTAISGMHTYTVEYFAKCSSGSATFTASNVVMSRDP